MTPDVRNLLRQLRVPGLAYRDFAAAASASVRRTEQRQGLVTTEPYRSIFLTTTGRHLAHESRHRHDIVVRLLKALGVPPAAAEADAEGIEHHVSRETLAAFVKYLASRDR